MGLFDALAQQQDIVSISDQGGAWLASLPSLVEHAIQVNVEQERRQCPSLRDSPCPIVAFDGPANEPRELLVAEQCLHPFQKRCVWGRCEGVFQVGGDEHLPTGAVHQMHRVCRRFVAVAARSESQ